MKIGKYLAESIAFGLTDGIICFIGLTIGVAKATLNPAIVITAGIAGGVADAFGNAVGFFMSQVAERSVQIYDEKQGLSVRPHTKTEVWMSGLFTFLSTVAVLVLLLTPFIFFDIWTAIICSFVAGAITSFSLGAYIGKLADESLIKSGVKYTCLTMLAAIIAYFIGEFLNIYFGVTI